MANTSALRPVARTPLYEVLVARLREHVQQTHLREGDRLPSERQLAQELAVSRASIRQALVALEVQGVIRIRHGGGSYLTGPDLNAQPFETIIGRRRRLPDILDTREALEVKLAELAAQRRDDHDLHEIESALDLMAHAVANGECGSEGDAAFHKAVTAAAHSPLMEHLMEAIAPDILESRLESLSQKGRPARSLRDHKAIAKAISESEPVKARAAMRRHLHSVGHVKLMRWTPDESTR